MKELPQFKSHKYEDVVAFVTQLLTHPNRPEKSFYGRLVEYKDGHYRLIFSLDYFASTSSEAPTKSQWNSLKKKLKRHDKLIFVFKEHDVISCDPPNEKSRCGYVEFGFFAH